MWSCITNNKTMIFSVTFLIICIIFLVIQWYENKKIRHKITKLDKHIHSLTKNQMYLEKVVTQLNQPQSIFQDFDIPISLPTRPQPPPPSPTSQMKPKSHTSSSQIFVISSEDTSKTQIKSQPKIEEIDDENDVESDDEITEEVDEKTLDLELEKELNELK